jgi:hypothetical protein
MQGLRPLFGQVTAMNYSICLLDAGGHTQRTESAPFDDDVSALAQARTEVSGSPIVELWKGERLLARLFRDPPKGPVQ